MKQAKKVWACELDIYGKLRKLEGDRDLVPFRYPGQYEDAETGLYYNRFRYYSPDEGVYISQDPIKYFGGLRVYGYVIDPNYLVDIFGLIAAPASLPSKPGVYIITSDNLNQSYVGNSVNMNDRVSQSGHTKAQSLLGQSDVRVEYVEVDLGTASDLRTQDHILRHYEQIEYETQMNAGYTMLNSPKAPPESLKKKARNQGEITQHGASASARATCA